MPNAYERPLKREVSLDLSADADVPDRFIAALEELIREMKATGTGYRRYELKAGRRIETAGGDILYHFPFTDEMELFLEAQIEIQVGQRRVGGTIASIGSSHLVLALKKDIGNEVRSAVLLIDATRLLEALKEKIEAVNKGEITLNRTLADAVVQPGVSSKRPARPIRAGDGSELDASQRKAYQAALREALTFIWGPPGCGKTMTLSAIVRSAFNSGKRTLICSNTNKAVDQVLYKICETLTHEHPAMEEGKVVRLGRIADDKLESKYGKYVAINEIVGRRSAELEEKKQQLEKKIARMDTETQKSKQQRDELSTELRETETEIAALEKTVRRKKQLEKKITALGKAARRKRQLKKEIAALGEYDTMEQRSAELSKKKRQLERENARLDAEIQNAQQCLAQFKALDEAERCVKTEMQNINQIFRKGEALKKELSHNIQRDALESLRIEMRIREFKEQSATAIQRSDQAEQTRDDLQAAVAGKDKTNAQAIIDKSTQQRDELFSQIRETEAESAALEKIMLIKRQLENELAALEQMVRRRRQLEKENAALGEYDTMEQHAAELKKKKRQLKKKIAQVDAKARKSKQQRDELVPELRETETEIATLQETESTALRKTTLKDSRIVGATCTTAYLTKEIGQFDLVIVDEASMVLRPAVWFSAGLARERVVISGDFRQIPPIVPTQQETIFQELGLDPFTATERTKPDAPGLAMLTTQYRMHPEICELISEPMYEGKLRTSPARKKVLGRLPPNPFEKPLTIIDTSDLRPVESQNASFSRLNKLHALLVRNFVRHLRLNGVIETNRDLGICTPYSAQARHIQKLLKEDGPDNLVHCGTVHRFQGDERRIVLLEIPESGGHRAIGQFVRGVPPDHVGARLISVAVSRAQEHFVVLANLTHLDRRLPSNSLLRSILHKIEQQGRVVPGGELLKLSPIDCGPTDLPEEEDSELKDTPSVPLQSGEHKGMNRQQAERLLQIAVSNPDARFRDGQWEAIDAVSNRRAKLLLVQRTGWGKSAVYFVATRIFRDAGRGLTIIVSPLLALMRNQVEAAQRLGIRAASIDSSNRDNRDAIITDLINDQIDALLITPERLANEDFRQSTLMKIADRIGLLVVDEAHCISDWGHDFRPDYRRLTNVLGMIPRNTPVLCTTATANDRVIGDIKTQLADFQIQRGPLSRHSLSLQTIRLDNQASRLAWLAQSIPQIPGSGIVYVLTKRDAEQVADWLSRHGISTRAYHAGIQGQVGHDKRRRLENMLLKNEIKVLVATTALGMGYDKPDLSFVIHYQAPSSVVAYYQQVGRAGRAIPSAVGILLAGKEDEQIHEYFRRTAFPPERAVEEVLDALEESDGKSIAELQNQLNMRKSQIEHVLKVLSVEVPSPIIKDGSEMAPHRSRIRVGQGAHSSTF